MKLKIKKSRILPQTHQDGYYIKKNVSKNVEKLEHLCTVSENVEWCSHRRKQYGGFLKKLKIGLPCDPAILLLGILPEIIESRVSKRWL